MDKRTFARHLRSHSTDVEQHLWYHLRNRRLLGLKFRRQHSIGPYVADFVCLDVRLVIELDGGQHQDNPTRDQVRDDWLRSQGFRILRVWNNDLLQNLEGVLQRIAEQSSHLPISNVDTTPSNC